jgi:aspartyl-tRNA(Asn)/glutamyl-tRNA(Gln) amidotransferase subunit C
MSLEQKEIETLFRLSQLEHNPEAIQEFGGKLEQILGYVDQLLEVDVEGVEPLMHPSQLSLYQREDIPLENPIGTAGIEKSPGYVDGFIRVPKIVE